MTEKKGKPIYDEGLVQDRLSLKRVNCSNRDAHAVVGNKGTKLKLVIRNEAVPLQEPQDK